MNRENSSGRLRDQIKEDLSQDDYWHTIKEDYSEVQEYFLDREKKERLKYMKPVKRFFHLNWWLLKAMIMNLSHVRRVLFLLGFVLTFLGNSVRFGQGNNNTGLLGAIIILFVLMLELKDKLLAKSELGEGRQVQQALMPNANPKLEGWEIWMHNIPANDVGGDLVDFIRRKDNSCLLTIGDVSGKGLGAALFSIKLQASIRTLTQESFTIKEIIYKVNELFYKDGIHNRFASLISLSLNDNSGEIEFVNAGHMPPIIYEEGEIRELQKGNIAIGLTNSPAFEIKKETLGINSVMILYSDGIIETVNEAGIFYGKERLLNLITKFGEELAEKLGSKLIKDVEFFRQSHKMYDDISVAVIKRKA